MIKPLRTEQDYQEALIEFDRIKEFPLDSKEGQKAEILSVLIEDYKSKYTALDSIKNGVFYEEISVMRDDNYKNGINWEYDIQRKGFNFYFNTYN